MEEFMGTPFILKLQEWYVVCSLIYFKAPYEIYESFGPKHLRNDNVK